MQGKYEALKDIAFISRINIDWLKEQITSGEE